MTETEKKNFIKAISSMSPSRLMTRDATYVISKCMEIDAALKAKVEAVNTPATLLAIVNAIRETPEHKAMEAAVGETFQVTDLIVNLCNVCEDVIVGRYPLPTDFAAALVDDFVLNIRAS